MGSRKRPKPNPKEGQSRPKSSEPTNKEVEALKTLDPAVSTIKLSDLETDSGADRKSTSVRSSALSLVME